MLEGGRQESCSLHVPPQAARMHGAGTCQCLYAFSSHQTSFGARVKGSIITNTSMPGKGKGLYLES